MTLFLFIHSTGQKRPEEPQTMNSIISTHINKMYHCHKIFKCTYINAVS